MTHKETGRLEARLADAIVKAADEVLGGQHRDQFIVDVYQAGAGTSHNMNGNEVLANRANELLGGDARQVRPGAPERSRQHGAEHQRRDPDRDAARDARDAPAASSTRCRYSCRVACWRRGREFDHIIKSGRTHLQDATPIRLGQEFTAYRRNCRAAPREDRASPRDWLRDHEYRRHGGGYRPQRRGAVSRAHVEVPRTPCKRPRPAAGRGPDPADAVDGRHRHVQWRAAGIRPRPQQDRERHPPARVGPAHRPRRDPSPGGAAGLEHHARQGEPVDRRDGEPGVLPGPRPRYRRWRWRPRRASSSST